MYIPPIQLCSIITSCMCIYICVCVCVCVYIYIYIYIYALSPHPRPRLLWIEKVNAYILHLLKPISFSLSPEVIIMLNFVFIISTHALKLLFYM